MTVTFQIYTEETICSSEKKDVVLVEYILKEELDLDVFSDLINFIGDHRFVNQQLSNDSMIMACLTGEEVYDLFYEFNKELTDLTGAVLEVVDKAMCSKELDMTKLYTLKVVW